MMPFLLLLTAAIARASSPGEDASATRIPGTDSHARAVEGRHVFSPRMDYDEWTPLGRRDPLKNDPTYDYVPPVLDRVHYWMDPSKRTPDPPLPNSHVMVLGSRTDPPTTTIPASSRLGTITFLDPFFKFMDASKVSLGFSTPISSYLKPTPNPAYHSPPHHNPPPKYGPPQTSTDYMPPPPPPPKIQALQRPPYTILMPPPPPSAPSTSTEAPVTSFGTSTRTTSEADDLYPTVTTTLVASDATTLSSSTAATETTASSTENVNKPMAQTTILATENLYKPVAITMPESMSNETNETEPSTPIPRPSQHSVTLPIQSSFHHHSNHLQDIERPKVLPPKNKDAYHGFLPTTLRPTTTVTTLTTDPMFKHYKQPSEAVRGPFYLIIQGHSKVKTYGASKNKVKPVSSNEINFDDGKVRNYDIFDSAEGSRREKKLRFKDSDYEENVEVVQGHPTIEVMGSFRAKAQAAFSVGEQKMEETGEADGKTSVVPRGRSATGSTSNTFASRRLLATLPTASDDNKPSLDQHQLGLESLIALNDDYNSEDILNLILKEEGQGSGFGGLVSSLLGKSLKPNDDF